MTTMMRHGRSSVTIPGTDFAALSSRRRWWTPAALRCITAAVDVGDETLVAIRCRMMAYRMPNLWSAMLMFKLFRVCFTTQRALSRPLWPRDFPRGSRHQPLRQDRGPRWWCVAAWFRSVCNFLGYRCSSSVSDDGGVAIYPCCSVGPRLRKKPQDWQRCSLCPSA